MTITEAMIEAGARAIYADTFGLHIGWDDDTERQHERMRDKARACLTAAIPAAEAQGAVLCVVPGEMDHMTAGTQSGPQFVTGHNACRAAVLAGRVVV
jgi:hypothetical protein